MADFISQDEKGNIIVKKSDGTKRIYIADEKESDKQEKVNLEELFKGKKIQITENEFEF